MKDYLSVGSKYVIFSFFLRSGTASLNVYFTFGKFLTH